MENKRIYEGLTKKDSDNSLKASTFNKKLPRTGNKSKQQKDIAIAEAKLVHYSKKANAILRKLPKVNAGEIKTVALADSPPVKKGKKLVH
jgi:hypothetical protein